MALGCLGLMFIGAIPTVIGIAEAIDAQKKQNQQAKERIKFHLTAEFSADGVSPPQTGTVVFKDNKLYLDHPSHPVEGFKFNGFYFPYPGEEGHQGLVAMAATDPPALHWIYSDKDTGLLRHGSRTQTLGHTIGPWSWSEDEEHLSLEAAIDKFCAVEEEDGGWVVHFDRDGNMEDIVGSRAVIDIVLHREQQLGVSSRYVGGKDGAT